MDTSDIVSIFLRGAVGKRGRKRAGRAMNFLTGNRGFLTASTVLGAAGVAWGIYDSLKGSGATAPGADMIGAAGAAATGAAGVGGVVAAPGAAGAPTAAASTMPPPIPGTMDPGPPLPNDLVRVVRLAVSAARADGALSPQERELILQHAREAGIEGAVEQELTSPRPLGEIVSGIADAQRREDLYALAFTIVRADESISGAERIYLAQLAHQLSLDPAAVSRLEHDIATRIDSTPE